MIVIIINIITIIIIIIMVFIILIFIANYLSHLVILFSFLCSAWRLHRVIEGSFRTYFTSIYLLLMKKTQ